MEAAASSSYQSSSWLDPVEVGAVRQQVEEVGVLRGDRLFDAGDFVAGEIVEQAFAKFKAALRKAAERTREALWQTIGRTLERYSPKECRNFFNQAGYAT